MRGFSDAYGSWNTICMRLRCGRIAPVSRCVMSSPSRRIVPSLGSSRRNSSLPTVDLPQPDSPTRHSVSPGLIAKLTPSTAFTIAALRPKNPALSAKCFFRLSTSTIA